MNKTKERIEFEKKQEIFWEFVNPKVDRITNAINYAIFAHQGQIRKTTGIPMVTHVISVASIIKHMLYKEYLSDETKEKVIDVVISGILHDTVEDTEVTLDDINKYFGERITTLVASNTEDKSKSWEERKQHTINSIPSATDEEIVLLLADKYSNLMDLSINVQKDKKHAFEKFKRGIEKQKWYFESIGNEIAKRDIVPNLLDEYLELVQKVFYI